MLRVTLLIAFCIGLSLWCYSLHLRYYTSDKKRDALDMNAFKNLADSERAKETYYREIEKIRTNKATLEDIGSGIAICFGTLIVLSFVFKINRIFDVLRLRSPGKTAIFILAITFFLARIPATIWYYTRRAIRGDYPSWADSIAIPIYEETLATFVALFLLILFLIITTFRKEYPTMIFVKPVAFYWKTITNEIIWGIILALCILNTFGSITAGDQLSIPINLFFIYLVFVLRAGYVKKFNETNIQVNMQNG